MPLGSALLEAADRSPVWTRQFAFGEDLARALKIVCTQEFCVGMAVDPDDCTLAIRTRGLVLDPVPIELFITARPAVNVIDLNSEDVENPQAGSHAR
jgi:hypothetical protein